MPIFKLPAVISPLQSDDSGAAAGQVDWLSAIVDHHVLIEFESSEVKGFPQASSRLQALKVLTAVLPAHSVAEEFALFTMKYFERPNPPLPPIPPPPDCEHSCGTHGIELPVAQFAHIGPPSRLSRRWC